jgi:hypothetical protein
MVGFNETKSTWVRNNSGYSIPDFLQIGLNELFYAPTIPDLRMVNQIEAVAEAAKRNNCECWCLRIVAHSQGTMVVKRALELIDKDTKKHISVIGLGGETTFGKGDGLNKAMNIFHVNDVVPNGFNRASFWNGNHGYQPIGDKSYEGDAHDWRMYTEHLKSNPALIKQTDCTPVR